MGFASEAQQEFSPLNFLMIIQIELHYLLSISNLLFDRELENTHKRYTFVNDRKNR